MKRKGNKIIMHRLLIDGKYNNYSLSDFDFDLFYHSVNNVINNLKKKFKITSPIQIIKSVDEYSPTIEFGIQFMGYRKHE